MTFPASRAGCLIVVQNPETQVRYDAEMGVLRRGAERLVHELAVGSRSGAAARRALLPRLHDLAAFFGPKCALEPCQRRCERGRSSSCHSCSGAAASHPPSLAASLQTYGSVRWIMD